MWRRRTGYTMLAVYGALTIFAARPPDGAPAFSAILAEAPAQWADDVDVELILAVDVSYSMDPDEQALQREGYVFALTAAAPAPRISCTIGERMWQQRWGNGLDMR
jgi:Protein of unknown function (DUF1194)